MAIAQKLFIPKYFSLSLYVPVFVLGSEETMVYTFAKFDNNTLWQFHLFMDEDALYPFGAKAMKFFISHRYRVFQLYMQA